MPSAKTAKVRAEIDKVRTKLAEQQRALKGLEAKRTEIENAEIVDMVRGLHIPLEDLTSVLGSLKSGKGQFSGQLDPKPKSPEPKKNETINNVKEE